MKCYIKERPDRIWQYSGREQCFILIAAEWCKGTNGLLPWNSLPLLFFSYWINELRRFVSSAISRWPPIKVRGFLTSSLDHLLFTTPAKGAIVVSPDVSPHLLRRKRGVCQCAELLCCGWEGARLHPLLVAGGWVWHSVPAQGGSEFGSVRWACTVSLGGGKRESVRWAGVRTAALMNIFFLTDQGAFDVFWIKVIYNNGSYLSLGWRFLMISFFNSRLFNNGSGKDNIFSKKRRGFVKPWKW